MICYHSDSSMTCPVCGNEVRPHERNCPVCDSDAGYPNVRSATEPAENAALESRLDAARASCLTRGTDEALMRLRAAVRTSKAVIGRSLHQVMALVSSDNELYASFYGQRRAGT